jgi:sodium transport system permease protein
MSAQSLWAGTKVVLRKELKDNLRDRRSMTSSLLMPLLGPLMFGITFSAVVSMTRDDKPIELQVRGMQNAPSLIAFLERNGVTVRPGGAEAEQLVRDGKLDLALSIPEDYAKEFSAGQVAKVELIADNSRNKSRAPVRRVQRLLQGYSAQLGSLRLLARGVSPSLAMPIAVEEIDLATPERTAASVLGMIPLFLLLSVFVGGMYVAIDSTAGERERGSLEPLLINPVTRAQVVLGKMGAVVVFAWLALLFALVGFSVALQRVPLQDLGVRAELGPKAMLGMVAVLLPLSLLASGLQMFLALFSRTFKEAQTWLSLMMIVPMVPASVLSISPIAAKTWMMLIPVFSQTLLLSDVLRGEVIPPHWHALAALSTLLCGLLSAAAAIRLIGQEKIVFGRGAGA